GRGADHLFQPRYYKAPAREHARAFAQRKTWLRVFRIAKRSGGAHLRLSLEWKGSPDAVDPLARQSPPRSLQDPNPDYPGAHGRCARLAAGGGSDGGRGLGSIPCAMLNAQALREQMANFRTRTKGPVNVNFFTHTPPELNNAREARWRER